MNCPNCSQPVDAATFCGNCGYKLRLDALETEVIPRYALPKPGQSGGETKALLSVIFGVIGIAGAVLMAVLGLAFGLAGIAMATMSRSSSRRRLSTAGLIISILAVIAGLGALVYAIKTDPVTTKQPAASSATSVATIVASDLSTPCYSLGFVDKLRISNNADSCNMKAFNGTSLETSTNAYKIYANKSEITTTKAFNVLAKQAIEKDVAENLTGFNVNSQKESTFAGSPSYQFTLTDSAHNVALVEAAVFHQTPSGNNVFIIIHALNGKTVDLQTLEAQWQWK
jgi:hypothetical protein